MTNHTYEEYKKNDGSPIPAHISAMTPEQREKIFAEILERTRTNPDFAEIEEDTLKKLAVMYFERTKEQVEEARRNSGAWRTFRWELQHGLGAFIFGWLAVFVVGVILLGLFLFAIHQIF